MSSDLAISIRSVSKRFEMYDSPRDRLKQFFTRGNRRYFKEFWALRDVSFDVRQGETIGILGRNGSGKSTLLQIIAGTLAATQGDVQVNGLLAALLELGSGFNPDFTGRENVYLNGAVLGFTKDEMDERFERIVAFADIGDHIDQPVRTYSSGMYVRLAFAVQACVEPKVLIVDEALSVGDEKFQRKCFEYIEGLRERGCAILIVTHATSTVEKFCQRAVLLHKGEVHGIGEAKAIIDQYHALLYSDERAYLRYLNSQNDGAAESGGVVEALPGPHPASQPEAEAGAAEGEGGQLRAYIKSWASLDASGERCEAFVSGQEATITFDVNALHALDEIQVGVLIRTVEGVSVFGSSTMYHNANLSDVRAGEICRAQFRFRMDLCEGTYFVTLALAEAISRSDMAYLDKKTDVIILRVSAPRTAGTGIAALPTSVDFNRLS